MGRNAALGEEQDTYRTRTNGLGLFVMDLREDMDFEDKTVVRYSGILRT